MDRDSLEWSRANVQKAKRNRLASQGEAAVEKTVGEGHRGGEGGNKFGARRDQG